MNKTVFLAIACFLGIFKLNAQNPAFTANDWVLTELSVNGTTTLPSNIAYLGTQDVTLQFTDSGTDYSFDTYVCSSEAISGSVSYPFNSMTSDQFTLLFSAQTAGTCCVAQADVSMPPDPDCVALLNFSADYFNLWSSPVNTNYDFEILNIANSITLRVTKPNGDFALYRNATASIQDSKLVDIYISKSKDSNVIELKGDDVNRIDSAVIYNLSGKRIAQMEDISNPIDISNYASGMYLMRLELDDHWMNLKFLKY